MSNHCQNARERESDDKEKQAAAQLHERLSPVARATFLSLTKHGNPIM